MSDLSEDVTCGTCGKPQSEDKGGEKWSECTGCEQWYHNVCVGLKESPRDEDTWLCVKCREKVRLENKLKQKEIDAANERNVEIEQIELMASLIKEKEELCEIKQKQLELMSQLSDRTKMANVERFVNKNPVGFLARVQKVIEIQT